MLGDVYGVFDHTGTSCGVPMMATASASSRVVDSWLAGCANQAPGATGHIAASVSLTSNIMLVCCCSLLPEQIGVLDRVLMSNVPDYTSLLPSFLNLLPRLRTDVRNTFEWLLVLLFTLPSHPVGIIYAWIAAPMLMHASM